MTEPKTWEESVVADNSPVELHGFDVGLDRYLHTFMWVYLTRSCTYIYMYIIDCESSDILFFQYFCLL